MSTKDDQNIIMFPVKRGQAFDVKIDISLSEVVMSLIKISSLSNGNAYFKKIHTELLKTGSVLSIEKDEYGEEWYSLCDDKKDHVLKVFLRHGLINIGDVEDCLEDMGGNDASDV